MCLTICSLRISLFLDYNTQVKYLRRENEYEISCDNGQTWNRIHATLSSNENRHILNCCINGHITKANFFSRPGYLTIFNEVYLVITKTFPTLLICYSRVEKLSLLHRNPPIIWKMTVTIRWAPIKL